MVGVAISNPPDKAVVVCIDEKSQIQALDRDRADRYRSAPGCRRKLTHDYVRPRHDHLVSRPWTVATGKVTDACHGCRFHTTPSSGRPTRTRYAKYLSSGRADVRRRWAAIERPPTNTAARSSLAGQSDPIE